ncbi:response regulator [Candidatus Sumerlaeota bacterium]|nr:response regulator [Candidatus Sumerlaeota bacterium]
MLDKKITILVIDKDASFHGAFHKIISQIPYLTFDFDFFDRLLSGMKQMERKAYDIILLNLDLPDSKGIHTLIQLKEKAQDIPVIVLDDTDNLDLSIDVIHQGAHDYLNKNTIQSEMFYKAIRYCLERSLAEKALIEKNKELNRIRLRYQAILRSTPNGLCIINPYWRIMWANVALNKILFPQGMSSPSSEGENFKVLFTREDEFNAFKKKARESFQKTDIFSREIDLVKGDGSPFIADISIVRIDPAETGGGYVATISDITARKKAEKALKQAQQELVQSEKMSALGRFASGVAHEIRNPLANIVSSAQYCLSKKQAHNDIIREYLEIMLRNAENANKIIKQLLDFAKPRQMTMQPADIQRILLDVHDSVKARCARQNVQMKIDIPMKLPFVSIDEMSMEEAFLNMIANALDAMPEGGHLLIRAYVDVFKSEMVIKFIDSGSGIQPEHLDKVFEPFFTTREDGVGLGMCLVHQIIKRHGGTIKIGSCPHKMTEVQVCLPLG